MFLPVSKEQIAVAKLPIQYEEACTALTACTTIDEAKYWADKSEALAAWAKIYRSNQAATEARRLRLHAFRRMGELALELRPKKSSQYRRGNPGPGKLLESQGIRNGNAILSLKLAKLKRKEFEKIVNSPSPPSPSKIFLSRSTMSKAYGEFSTIIQPFRSYTRRIDARELARSFEESDLVHVRRFLPDLIEWLDTLDQHLPKPRI